MVTKRKKTVFVAILLFLCLALVITWMVLSPSYERAKRHSEEFGDKPHRHETMPSPKD
jgi:hypothetical protein